MTVKKIDRLRAYMDAGEWDKALKLAATFPRLGARADAITRAWEATARPEIYRQMGHDPAALVTAGIAALTERYGAECPTR